MSTRKIGSRWYEFTTPTGDSIVGMRFIVGHEFATLEEARAARREIIEAGREASLIHHLEYTERGTVRVNGAKPTA